jgi:hypothetical protein
MSRIINIENYESFYLDFLDGNLNENDTALLLAFLEENPSLKVDDSEFAYFSSEESAKLDDFSKSLLKFQGFDQIIDSQNIEYFLIASVEKQLSEEKARELQQFLIENPSFLVDLQLYGRTQLIADSSIVYPEKNKLKRGIVIPMYARFLAAAAGIALFFSIVNLNQTDQPQRLVHGGGKNPVQVKSKPELKKEIQTQWIATTTSEVVNDVSTQEVGARREKLLENTQFENIEPLGFKSPEKLNNQPLLNDIAIAYIKPFAAEKISDDLDENTFAAVEMKNPILPITNKIGEAINQQVEFKTSKAAKKKPGGFLFRIGKFEISRKVYDNTSIAAK